MFHLKISVLVITNTARQKIPSFCHFIRDKKTSGSLLKISSSFTKVEISSWIVVTGWRAFVLVTPPSSWFKSQVTNTIKESDTTRIVNVIYVSQRDKTLLFYQVDWPVSQCPVVNPADESTKLHKLSSSKSWELQSIIHNSWGCKTAQWAKCRGDIRLCTHSKAKRDRAITASMARNSRGVLPQGVGHKNTNTRSV